MKLLFITQKLHGQDAFGVLWVEAFKKIGYEVEVICLEWRPEGVVGSGVVGSTVGLLVHSLGKETGNGKIAQIIRYWKYILTLDYDRVFIHMAPVWMTLGWWAFVLRRKPVYLWYTHYKMQLGVRLFKVFGRRAFCATPQSLPQWGDHPKKQIVGHGIDMNFWPKRENIASDPKKLLMVHRLSRSKRVEIVLKAMVDLPDYRLDIYGIEAEPDYVRELKALISDLKLSNRVTFHGTIPMKDLPELYTHHCLILNMASETIDKTMLEAMTCGCYPVTTKQNAEAIGIPPALTKEPAPKGDTPEVLASFIKKYSEKAPIDADQMYRVVEKWHSLDALVKKMDLFIRDGR